MAGVLLVTHGQFGHALLEAAENILGDINDCQCIGIDVARGMDVLLDEIKTTIKKLASDDGVLILTDMFGGTPTNLSLSLMGTLQVEVITGVNLPMLLKILSSNDSSLAKLASEAKSAGKQGIQVAGELLRRKVGDTKS
jgi:PTS system mannose-specific IIA component